MSYSVTDNLTTKSENKLQSECFQWAWNNLPETRRLLCYNLNNSKNRIDGARNKAMGLIPGRADMVLYWKGTAYMLEFKTEKGKQSKEQKEWQSAVSAHNFPYHIIRSFDQFQQIIKNICNT